MKTVCLYFQVHQPWRLKKYRFFNMAYDAFINYMNVLSDFIIELDQAVAAKAAKAK
mgnify:CR=1 FL=1